MPTAAQIAVIDREIALLKSGAMSGDFMRRRGQRAGPGPAEQRMIRQLSIARLSPVEKAAFKKAELQRARANIAAKAFVNTFKYTPMPTLIKAKTNPNIEKLRALSLDDYNKDQWLNFFRALPNREIYKFPLGKFRFNWDKRGNKVYVPWTSATWQNFFKHEQRGRWIPNIPFRHKCSPNWEDKHVKEYTNKSEKWARKYSSPRDYRHVWQHVAGASKCKKPKKSLWVKIRHVVVGAALVVAAVYLGPIVVAKVKAITGGGVAAAGGTATGTATGTAASAVTQATTFQKIQAGTKTLLSYVNKARTVNAIVKGKLPPPPIGIPGASFRDWALIVAKEKLKEEAIEKAMELGTEYIAKKMTKKMENELKAEIAAMQAELIRLTPKEVLEMPPEPDPELAEPIKKIQIIEGKRADDLQKFIVPAAIVAGAVILGG